MPNLSDDIEARCVDRQAVLDSIVAVADTKASPDWADDMPLVAIGLDSLKMVELVLELEAKLGLVIPDELLTAEHFRTVGTVLAALTNVRP